MPANKIATVLFVCVVSLMVQCQSLRLAALQGSGRILGVGAAVTALLQTRQRVHTAA